MQYFVSIENTTYFYWQIDLLIESFKMCGQEDNLVIAIAENDGPKSPNYGKNLLQHKHRFMHNNLGKNRNYLPLNKFYGLTLALSNKVIKSPFAVIHPDMVLQKPLEEPDVNILFQNNPNTIPLVEKIKPQLEEMAEKNKFDLKRLPPSIPLGATMVFKNVAPDFFNRVMARTNWFISKNPQADWDLATAAWLLTIYEHLTSYKTKAISLECRLIDNDFPANLIHYRSGLPPVFSKKYYKGLLQVGRNPYDVLMAHNPTSATEFMRKVVQSYRAK